MPSSAEVSPNTSNRAARSSANRTESAIPLTRSTLAPSATVPVAGLNFNENAWKTPRRRFRAGTGCRPVAVRIDLTKAWLRATGRGVPGVASTFVAIQPLLGDLGKELVEKHRLTHAAQSIQDPAPVTLAVLIRFTPHDFECVEGGLPGSMTKALSERLTLIVIRLNTRLCMSALKANQATDRHPGPIS